MSVTLLKKKEIGWKEIGEEFTRYVILKTPWFQILLHRLWSPNWHPSAHNHPWSFVTIILRGGYIERVPKGWSRWRGPGSLLYRPAEFAHNVATGGSVCWSLVITGPKRRQWQFVDEATGEPVASDASYEE